VVNPDDIVAEYGADSLRLYEMFMGPLEQVKPWDTRGVGGVRRFLNRVWRVAIDDRTGEVNAQIRDEGGTKELERALHKTIKKVTEDTEGMRFNTAVSAMMELTNEMSRQDVVPVAALESLLILLSPYAPHISEEIWNRLGHEGSITTVGWPQFDEALTKADTIIVPVQVNGKVRAKIEVPADADKEAVLAAARTDEKVLAHLEGKELVREIYVPGRIVNLVVV
jgi:leucyl-tRNA synthetase